MQAKINFILHVFLEILRKYCKLVILGALGMPGYAHLKYYYQLVEASLYINWQKINFIPHVFMEILLRYANLLFWVLCSCLHTHIQYDSSINLQKTLIFIYKPKINFIIHLFFEILHFKEFWNWLANSISAHNSRTGILPDMWLMMKNQLQY